MTTPFQTIKNACAYKTYPLERYFTTENSESQFVVSKLFEENLQREFFSLINEHNTPELFFHSFAHTVIPDHAEVSMDIMGYYKGVIHCIMNFITINGELADTKKCAFTIAEKYASPDLPVIVTAIESGEIIINYYSFEDNEISIFRRVSVVLSDEEREKLRVYCEMFYDDTHNDMTAGDVVYTSDIFSVEQMSGMYFVYEVNPSMTIIDIETLARNCTERRVMLMSGIKRDAFYLISNADVIDYIHPEALVSHRKDRLDTFYFNFDYYLMNNRIFTVYNDARTSIEIKYYLYSKKLLRALEQREDVQFFTILLDNNRFDYGIVKEAFLFEKDQNKKLFFAMNILDFSIIEDFELVLEYILHFKLNEYEIHFVSRRISQRHTKRFKDFTARFQEQLEQVALNMSVITRYVIFYNKVYELIFLADHYNIDEMPNMSRILNESLLEFNKDILQLIVTMKSEKAVKLLNLANQKEILRLTVELLEHGKMTQDDIDLRLMDLKDALHTAIHESDGEVQSALIRAMRELF